MARRAVNASRQATRTKTVGQLAWGGVRWDAAKNRRIVDGVIRGVAHYGNCFGVPTVG